MTSSGSLAMGSVVSCGGVYTVTTDNGNSIERMTNTTVTAKDEYGSGVDHSYAKMVERSMVSG